MRKLTEKDTSPWQRKLVKDNKDTPKEDESKISPYICVHLDTDQHQGAASANIDYTSEI